MNLPKNTDILEKLLVLFREILNAEKTTIGRINLVGIISTTVISVLGELILYRLVYAVSSAAMGIFIGNVLNIILYIIVAGVFAFIFSAVIVMIWRAYHEQRG